LPGLFFLPFCALIGSVLGAEAAINLLFSTY